MGLFDKKTSLQDLSEYSLDIIKTAIKTAKATSPEREELIKDLVYIADTIENQKSQAIICNRAICTKYPAIFNVAQNYQLCRITDEQAITMSQAEQIIVLHQIAHYLRDSLNSETLKVKGLVIAKEATKSILGYAAKQILK